MGPPDPLSDDAPDLSRNGANVRAYERIARVYAGDAPAEDDPALRETCRALFAARLRGRRVLEVGCGPGVDAERLRQRGLDVLATDACDAFLAIVRERYPLLRTAKLDLAAPALDERFDGIYGFACLVHLPRALVRRAVEGLHRLLDPGGVLFLSLARSDRLGEYLIEDWGGVPGNTMLFTCHSEEALRALLVEVGFVEIELFHVATPVYEAMPRLVERGVTLYQVAARRA